MDTLNASLQKHLLLNKEMILNKVRRVREIKELIERLGKLTDTRRQRGNLRYKLVDIVFIGLVSVICGRIYFEYMEDRGYIKVEWLKNY